MEEKILLKSIKNRLHTIGLYREYLINEISLTYITFLFILISQVSLSMLQLYCSIYLDNLT